MKIPKIIHQIWIGPKDKPVFTENWAKMNPDYEYILWDDEKVKSLKLINKKQYDLFGKQYHGKSDVLRYEILMKYGGIYIDADCEPLRPLDDFLLESDFFSCYANEKLRGDRLANGIIGCVKNHFIMRKMVNTINNIHIIDKKPFELVGPVLFTKIYNDNGKPGIIYPSHYFLPEFYNGDKYNGNFKPISYHYWGTTKSLYSNGGKGKSTLYKKKKNGYSIIVTAYQTSQYIEECLDSIMLQDYFLNNYDYEILLGIDGCDETLNMIKKIQGKYHNLRVFYMEKNMGTYVTSNTLIKHTKYGRIIRFDSDDIMLPDMVSRVDNRLTSNDVVRLGFYDFTNNNTKTKPGTFVAHGAICYKKKVIFELGGYRNWPCSADTDLIYRFKPEYKVFDNNEYYFYRRVHNNSLTKNNTTGIQTNFRKEINAKLKKGFEYVEPVTNDFIEIYPEKYIGEIKYNFITRHVVQTKNQKTNSRPPTRAKLKQQQTEKQKEINIKPEVKNTPTISKKAIPVKPSKLYIPTENPSSTRKIHDELAAGRLRKGRGYNPRHKKW
jgi:hypothetical protein